MVRILVFLAIVFLLAIGFAWLAERPGELVLTLQNYEIRTSLVVALAAAIALVAAISFLFWLVRALVSSPQKVGAYLGQRRRDRGYRALSRGIIAVGAGDRHVASRAARDATSLLADEPLALLLTAQSAQLAGDNASARSAFETLAARNDTRTLGLHGLFIEARRQGEFLAARHFAEEAFKASPGLPWAGTALLEYQAQAGDWTEALATLKANADAKLVDRDRAKRLRAVLLTAQAVETEAGNPEEARRQAEEAHRLAPELTEAAAVAGRLAARAGDLKRGARILEASWRIAPHPEIAEAYATLRTGDALRDRLKRIRRLASLHPNHPESAMALARAAIDTHEWAAAREALEGLIGTRTPSERVCLLMAEIEKGEHGDEGRARQWMARALRAPLDPAWIADGQVFTHWAAVSPVSGRLDAFEWAVPPEAPQRAWVREIETEGGTAYLPAVLEAEPIRDVTPSPAPTPRAPPVDAVDAEIIEPVPEPSKPKAPEAAPEAEVAAAEEPFTPRIPDDPGPEPVEGEPKRFFGAF